jgi:molybdopterin biosynthesis enzyme
MTSQSMEASSLGTSQDSSTQEGPTLVSVEKARSGIIDAIRPLNAMRIELGGALGRAEDSVASRSHPPAAVAAIDGYALRSADALSLPVKLKKSVYPEPERDSTGSSRSEGV